MIILHPSKIFSIHATAALYYKSSSWPRRFVNNNNNNNNKYYLIYHNNNINENKNYLHAVDYGLLPHAGNRWQNFLSSESAIVCTTDRRHARPSAPDCVIACHPSSDTLHPLRPNHGYRPYDDVVQKHVLCRCVVTVVPIFTGPPHRRNLAYLMGLVVQTFFH